MRRSPRTMSSLGRWVTHSVDSHLGVGEGFPDAGGPLTVVAHKEVVVAALARSRALARRSVNPDPGTDVLVTLAAADAANSPLDASHLYNGARVPAQKK